MIAEIDPWSASTLSIDPNPGSIYCDGTTLVFEARMSAGYKAITRHECDLSQQSALRRFVNLLNEISDHRLIAPDTFDP